MGNEANKKFTWVIKNFSSFSSYGSNTHVFSDILIDRCKWRLLAYPIGNNYHRDCLSLYMVVPNSEYLPSWWRRQAKFSFTIVNQIPGELLKFRETQNWFDEKNHTLGFDSMISLYDLDSREFLVNNELKIVAEVDVLEVAGKLDVPLETTEMVNMNGFQVLAFTKSLNEILCKSPVKLSNGDLADAYSSLRYVAKAGFKFDWLEKALKEAGETRIQEVEEELNCLTNKRADMDDLLVFLKRR